MPLPVDPIVEEDEPYVPDPSDAQGWATRLLARLDARRPAMQKYRDYYDGKQPLVYASDKFRGAFGETFKDFADNFADLVVDAVEERLNVQGFLPVGGEGLSDTDAWEIWLSNGMEAMAQVCNVEALTTGTGYAIVWGDSDDQPVITVESADDVIVAVDRADRRRRVAAVKRWIGEDGHFRLIVYRPDYLWKFRSEAKADSVASVGVKWEPWEVPGEVWPLPNPLGEVPVIPLVTRPPIKGAYEGRSELRSVIPVQDAINLLCIDMLTAADFSAFKQRWVTGMDIPVDPLTGEPVEPFKAAVDRVWFSEDPNTKFGEFTATDLSNYVQGIEMLLQHLATKTRTPPHYFFLNGQYPSGDAIKSAETGLVAKVTDRSVFLGAGWGEVIRLAFKVQGDARGLVPVRTLWGEFEYRSEAELADAALKMAQIGVPREALWQRWGATPQQIEDWRTLRATDTFERLLAPEPNA